MLALSFLQKKRILDSALIPGNSRGNFGGAENPGIRGNSRKGNPGVLGQRRDAKKARDFGRLCASSRQSSILNVWQPWVVPGCVLVFTNNY